MLKALDELEKTVVDLLERFRDQSATASGSMKDRPDDRDGSVTEREQEAAELVKRAIRRLKSL